MSHPTVLVDCRLLGIGGAGRATELLLRGLREIQPPGRWILWGPPGARSHLWPGADLVREEGSPTAWAGQRQVLNIPPHDVGLYMHQVRPLRPGRSVTVIHDTIQLRYGKRSTPSVLKKAFLKMSARLSTRIVTVSRFSRDCLVRDLGIEPARIHVVPYPTDALFAQRIHLLRKNHPPRNEVLFVGRFAPHKNLERLILAWGRSSSYAHGGTLRLVGGGLDELDYVRGIAGKGRIDRVEVEGVVPQERLEMLYATARMVIMPSLEEGFGLPLWEAMCCGLPVAASRAGSLPEVGGDQTVYFDPLSIEEMADAIDVTASRPIGASPPPFSSVSEFAEAFVDQITLAARGLAARG